MNQPAALSCTPQRQLNDGAAASWHPVKSLWRDSHVLASRFSFYNEQRPGRGGSFFLGTDVPL